MKSVAVTSALLLCAFSPIRAALPAGPDGSSLVIPSAGHQPARRMTTLDVMRLRDIGGQGGYAALSISPDGKHVAFEMHQADLDRNTYRIAWFVASTSGPATAKNVGDAGDAQLYRLMEDIGNTPGFWTPETPVWFADSSAIAYRRLVDGAVQIWSSARAGRRQEQLTFNEADVEHFTFSRDGSKILFAVDAARALKRQAKEALAQEGYLFKVDDFMSFLGEQFPRRYALIGGKPEIWVYSIAERQERRASDSEAAEYASIAAEGAQELAAFGHDARLIARHKNGRSVAWLSPAYPDKQGEYPPMALFASRSPGGEEPIHCAAPACTGLFFGTGTNQLWWSDDAREIYFVGRDGPNYGRRTWYAWNVDRDTLRSVVRTDDDSISACSFVHPRAICFRETPRHPRVVAAINLKTGSIETLVDPNPEMHGLTLGAVERLEWSDAKGRSTFGFLVKPVNYVPGKRFPLVIVGYKAADLIRGGTGHEYPAHVFAANDIGVLVYDMPEDWQGRATALGMEQWKSEWRGEVFILSATLAALEAAIDLLDRRSLIDATKVGITGFSTGNSQVNFALVNSHRFAAASISGPPWNPMGYYLNQVGDAGRAFYRSIGLGPPTEPEGHFWKSFALTLNVDRINTPVLINASDSEYITGRDTVTSFAEARKPIIEMHVYPREGHVKWEPKHKLSVYDRNVDWFNFWLRGVEDSSPAKAAQYERWKAMQTSQCERLKGNDAPWYCRPEQAKGP